MRHTHGPKEASAADELFEYRSTEKKKLKLVMAITGLAMLIEVAGGLFANSLALISDAGHMFTHFFALAVSFGAIVCASIKSCHHRTFGFYRAEILAALFNSIFLFVVTAWILIEGIKRIIHPAPVLGIEMFIIALIGLAVNLVSVLVLHGTGKDYLNIRSAFFHMLADTISSVMVVIGAVIIYFTGWDTIDPILSIIIAFVICKWGWELFRDSVNILLESAPKGLTSDEVADALKKEIPAISEISDIHVWEITSKMYSMTAHVKLREGLGRNGEKEVLEKVKKIVDEKFDIEHTTIEID